MKRSWIIAVIGAAALFVLMREQVQKPQDEGTRNNPNPHEQFQAERLHTMLEDEEYTLG